MIIISESRIEFYEDSKICLISLKLLFVRIQFRNSWVNYIFLLELLFEFLISILEKEFINKIFLLKFTELNQLKVEKFCCPFSTWIVILSKYILCLFNMARKYLLTYTTPLFLFPQMTWKNHTNYLQLILGIFETHNNFMKIS